MHSIGPEKLTDRLRDELMTRVAMSPDQPGARVTKIRQPTLVRRAMATVADAEDYRRGIKWCFSSSARVWNKIDALESRRMRVTASAAMRCSVEPKVGLEIRLGRSRDCAVGSLAEELK
jgi:hypothetical protein